MYSCRWLRTPWPGSSACSSRASRWRHRAQRRGWRRTRRRWCRGARGRSGRPSPLPPGQGTSWTASTSSGGPVGALSAVWGLHVNTLLFFFLPAPLPCGGRFTGPSLRLVARRALFRSRDERRRIATVPTGWRTHTRPASSSALRAPPPPARPPAPLLRTFFLSGCLHLSAGALSPVGEASPHSEPPAQAAKRAQRAQRASGQAGKRASGQAGRVSGYSHR